MKREQFGLLKDKQHFGLVELKYVWICSGAAKEQLASEAFWVRVISRELYE